MTGPKKVAANMQQTKELLTFFILLGKAIEKSTADDGQITLKDAPNLFPLLFAATDAFQGITNVPLELSVESPEAFEELKKYVKDELDLQDDKMEIFIEDSFGVAVDLWRYLSKYILKTAPTLEEVKTEVVDIPAGAPAPQDIVEVTADVTDTQPVEQPVDPSLPSTDEDAKVDDEPKKESGESLTKPGGANTNGRG